MHSTLYERQLNLIGAVLEFHPDFMDVLSDAEQAVFRRYFSPDRSVVKDVDAYRKALLREDPGIEAKATDALRHFLTANHLAYDDLLLPPEVTEEKTTNPPA